MAPLKSLGLRGLATLVILFALRECWNEPSTVCKIRELYYPRTTGLNATKHACGNVQWNILVTP